MTIIVIGAGMIGRERIKALEELGHDIVVVDPVVSTNHPTFKSLDEAIEHYTWAEWLFICTPHHVTPQIAEAAYSRSFNILCEKPLGRNLREYNRITRSRYHRHYNVGFNYRFYKGVRQLLKDCKDKLFGDLISVNMVLSLGDGPGSDSTWRLDPARAGRGAILDPGIHLIDLAMLISEGRLTDGRVKHYTGFWNTGIEEESHLLAHDTNAIYNLQASVCHWRNTFRVEVNGTEGYGIVEGRNRFYGPQTYRRGRRWGWQSGQSQRESEELVVDYDGEDSFLEETRAVLSGSAEAATDEDNRRCLEFIDRL